MKRRIHIILTLLVTLVPILVKAQGHYASNVNPGSSSTFSTFYLKPDVSAVIAEDGDTITCMWFTDFIKYQPLTFRSAKERAAYTKLIRDVKRTLPYAKEIARIITETYEYMETLPDDKARQRHLNKMEKYLLEAYTPKMKKLTRSQGQLLIKLVDRETSSSSYHIIDAFMGSLKAWSYNLFAGIFGNSLKERYNPYGEDRLTERVCVLVEQGSF